MAIAGVLAMNPKILILDEPTAGLDPKGRDEILDQIAELHKDRGLPSFWFPQHGRCCEICGTHHCNESREDCMYDDTPKKVFAHYKELEEMGLAAPQITYIMHDLKARGADVDVDATTIEEAAEEIARVWKAH